MHKIRGVARVVSALLIMMTTRTAPAPHRNTSDEQSPIIVGDIHYVRANPLSGVLSDLRLPTPATDIRIFPDQKRFLYSNYQWVEEGGMMLGQIRNHHVATRLLMQGECLAPCPSWNQREIALAYQHQITILNLPTGKVRTVATFPKRYGELAAKLRHMSPIYHCFWMRAVWTRNDRWLLCMWHDDRVHGERYPSLWVVDPYAQRPPRKLLDNAGDPQVNPVDGKVAFLRYSNKDGEPARVWVARYTDRKGLLDKRPLPITTIGTVAWSPDGRKLAYITPHSKLKTYDLASGISRGIADVTKVDGFHIAW